jgi:long-chain fatty acid transport protein
MEVNDMRKILMICCLLAAAGALLAGGFALSGVGARAISMGGAFRGLADDYTAVYWNPAGLAFIKDNQFTLAMASIAPTTEYTPALTDATSYPLGWPGVTDGKKYTAEDRTWAFPNIYYAKKAECNFNYGFGAYVPYGLGAKWDIYTPPATMPADTTGDDIPENALVTYPSMPKTDFNSSIAIVDIHPAASYMINERLSVGAGISVLYGMIEIQKLLPLPIEEPTDANTSTYVPTLMKLKGDGMGFGANAGVMFKATDKIQLGLSGKIPTSIKLKGDASVNTYLNNLVMYKQSNYTVNAPYTSTSKYDGEATLNLPAEVGLGVGFHATDKLTLTGDIAWTGWSCLDKIEITLKSDEGEEKSELNTNWDDAMRYSLGCEYDFGGHFGMDQVMGRLGFHYDESPIPDTSLDPTWPDVGNKTSFNAGFGLNKGHYGLDFGFEYMSFVDRTIDKTIITDGTPDTMAGKYDTSLVACNIGLTYKF